MLIFALDDEEAMLAMAVDAIRTALPEAEVMGFSRPTAALAKMDGEGLRPDVVFLDIEMPGMSGLELAKHIKDRFPRTNIVFVTGFTQYALEAMELYPSGYMLKPVTAEKIRREMENLRHPLEHSSDKRLRVQCFGHFEVFAQGKPLNFRYAKTKELLAYLIDRKGAAIHSDELLAVLWEDKRLSPSLRSQLRNSIADLIRVLKAAGAEDVLIKSQRSFSIDTARVDCDYYHFLQGRVSEANAYGGQYMAQYSWAETTIAALGREK